MNDWRENVTWYTGDTFIGELVKAVLRPPYAMLTKTTIKGFENIPTDGPNIVAANHIAWLDILSVGLTLPRHPHFMAKKELFKNPVVGWVLRQGGSFPVDRGAGDNWALTQAGRVLRDGEVLFMFPEGTRSKKGTLKRGKIGVVKLALEHQVPVIPVAVWGTENFKLGWKRTPVQIRFGAPIDVVAEAGPPPYPHEVLRNLTTQMMQRIAVMLPESYRGFYADSEDA